MAQTQTGAFKIAAKRAGVAFEDYMARIAAGEKWCFRCRSFKPLHDFTVDRSRGDGRCAQCVWCARRRADGMPPKKFRNALADVFGLSWCNACKMWVASWDIRNCQCSDCNRAAFRRRYATNHLVRHKARESTRTRRKNVGAIDFREAEYLTERFGGKCAYCGKPADSWDHITPVSKGGTSRHSNILPACRSCNSSKNNDPVEEWLDRRTDLNPTTEAIEQIVFELYVL
jgi:hypothetical protein